MADATSPAERLPSPSRDERLRSPGAILAAVGFAMFIAADDLTVVSTMLRPMINDVGLVLPDGIDDASWIVNVYLLAFIAVMPIAGRVSDLVGRRRVLTVAYLAFAVGSVVIAATSSYPVLLVGRVLTALGGGAMVPVALAVVADAYPVARRVRALGVLAAIETLGWVWGPLYGAALVRFASWRWQFWLNLPLVAIGLVWLWWALGSDDRSDDRRPAPPERIDLVGTTLLTVALVGFSLALLGNAEIQSVSGLDELTGGSGPDMRWALIPATIAAVALVLQQRGRPDPLVDPALIANRSSRAALGANLALGAGLVIAMVDVPLFVNAVEPDVERAAVAAGAALAAMTGAMAVTSYLGGRWTERVGPRRPTLLGLAIAAITFVVMGRTWAPGTSTTTLAAGLAVLGAGFGLITAPTTAAVVDRARVDRRGVAASLVMVVRLLGLSLGLAALTAWGLRRFNALRSTIELPPITDPGFAAAAAEASARLTAEAIAQTFLAAAALTALGLVAAVLLDDEPTDPTPTGATMQHFADDHGHDGTAPIDDPLPAPAHRRRLPFWALVALGALGIGLVATLLLVGVLWQRLQQTEEDLARVEAGSALFAAQVTGFQQQLVDLEPLVSDGVETAIAELEEFKTSTISFEVPIDETIPIRTDVRLERTISFPVDETINISETIDTTIEIDTGLGFEVPVDVSVPVDVDVPIQLDVEVPIDETVPVEVDIPVQLNVPIEVAIEGTELELLATSLQEGLRSLDEVLAGLGG